MGEQKNYQEYSHTTKPERNKAIKFKFNITGEEDVETVGVMVWDEERGCDVFNDATEQFVDVDDIVGWKEINN